MMILIIGGILFALFALPQFYGKVINKIAIVGSGPGGLGLCASLKRLNCRVQSIDVFEARSTVLQTNLGGGVQLSGGSKVLEELGLLSNLKKVAIPLKIVKQKDKNGKILSILDFEKASLEKRDADLRSTSEDGSSSSLFYAIMRDALQSLLYESISRDAKRTVGDVKFLTNKKCVQVEEKGNGKVSLLFEDGSSYGDYDLVIGADGTRSSVKQYITEERPSFLNKLKLGKLLGDSKYFGTRVTFILTPPLSPSETQAKNVKSKPFRSPSDVNNFHQYFGDGCYTLCSTYGGSKGLHHMLAVVYNDDINRSLGEKNWLESSSIKGVKVSTDSTDDVELRFRKAGFTDPEIFSVLAAADKNRIVDVGLSDRYIPVINWSSKSGRVLLLGDAAHPMTPFLGQGANQALQDAFFIANKIKNINDLELQTESREAVLKDLCISYESTRKLFTTRLSVTAGILGYIETFGGILGENFRNNLFRFLGVTGITVKSIMDIASPRMK